MPWRSKQQARWGHSPEGIKALGGEEKVAEWDSETTQPLPERLTPTKEQKAKAALKRGMQGKGR